jgi:hypothetical protein
MPFDPGVQAPLVPERRPKEGSAGTAAGTVAQPARSGVRDTSMAAYQALKGSGKLGAQQLQVLAAFGDDPKRTFTRQELARATGLGINAVCGRVNELMKEPFAVLCERGKKQCAVTGNSVNALALNLEGGT